VKDDQPITVEIIQAMLQAHGFYHGKIDNDWGPQTQAAMDSFQRNQGVIPPPWLIIAERELGVHETPGPQATHRIVEYAEHTTLKATSDEIPRCSSFVNFCIDLAGYKGTHNAAARSWSTWASPTNFRYGLIAVLSRGDPSSGMGHVGFAVFRNGNTIALLAGNQSDQVCVHTMTTDRLLTFRWPA
jgi:uncharacterized protein (TIGR02594 family)